MEWKHGVILVLLLTLQQQQAEITFGIFLHNDALVIKHCSKYLMRFSLFFWQRLLKHQGAFADFPSKGQTKVIIDHAFLNRKYILGLFDQDKTRILHSSFSFHDT